MSEHVARFNRAVTSGDWSDVVAGFDDHARLEFVGVPVGPYIGRAAIEAAYRDNPPDDTMTVRGTRSAGDRDVVDFAWTSGGTGVMTLDWTPDERVRRLSVEFQTETSRSTDG